MTNENIVCLSSTMLWGITTRAVIKLSGFSFQVKVVEDDYIDLMLQPSRKWIIAEDEEQSDIRP